jgi:hypothetical protein
MAWVAPAAWDRRSAAQCNVHLDQELRSVVSRSAVHVSAAMAVHKEEEGSEQAPGALTANVTEWYFRVTGHSFF